MKWEKKGRIFCADHTHPWAISHAALPTPWFIDDRIMRLYCAFRDAQNVSRIGYADVLAENPKEIVGISSEPALDIGPPGTFDDNGVVPCSIVPHSDKLYLYYSGYKLGTGIPYTILSGLAVSENGGYSFRRYQQSPILDRSDNESSFRAVPFVLKENGIWKMWYIGGSEWIKDERGKKLPVYTLKYLESSDGIHWERCGHKCLDFRGDEHGFGRPYILREKNSYVMYYSIRTLSKRYRLGYAESADGKSWMRKDGDLGLDISPSGPDSDMMCFGAIIRYRDRTYIFYNGNNYGGTGICYAQLMP